MEFLSKNKESIFKILFSSVFSIMALLVICSDYFAERIDYLVIILVLLAFLPWIIRYIKYLELNGIGKVELFDKKEQQEINETIGKIEAEKVEKDTGNNKQNNEFSEIISIDKNSVNVYDIISRLFLFRVEIEQEINEMMTLAKLDSPLNPTLMNKAAILYKNGIIKEDECTLLNKIIPKLNTITHNDIEITIEDFWTLYSACETLISSLEFRKGVLQF